MATNFYFVPARTTGHENPVLNGYRFYKDRIRDDKYYWKCCCCRKHGCKARIQTLDRQLISPIPEHKHDVQHAETEVHKAKQSLKRRAAESDLATKFQASEVLKGMDQEARAKVGCHPSSLARMARRSRQASKRHPANPRITQPIHAAVHGSWGVSKRVALSDMLRPASRENNRPLQKSAGDDRHIRSFPASISAV